MVHDTLMTVPQHPHDRTTTPSWPHHNTLVTVPQHPRDLTTTPSWPHHKGLLKPSPTLPLVARKARNFPHRETFRLEDSSQLPPFFCNETSHLATQLLPERVGMLKFRTTNKCTKYRKKHRKRGQTCLLKPSRGRKITYFVPFSRQLSRVQKDSKCCILLIYSLLNKKNTNGRLFQFQLFQLLFWGCPFPYIYM